MLKYIPNALTILRFFLIPFIIGSLFREDYILCFALLTISGITDIVDGFIARKFNCITNFGKLIDPLADKATQISILAVLVIQTVIPFWILVVVLLKEFILVSGASFLYGKELVVSSKWYGKLSTVIFYVAIVCSLLIRYWNFSLIGKLHFNLPIIPLFDKYIYYLALLATLFSLIMYFKAFYMQGYLKKEGLKITNDENNKKEF